jgi:hypothetical protein
MPVPDIGGELGSGMPVEQVKRLAATDVSGLTIPGADLSPP